jgi:hypothetical protein
MLEIGQHFRIEESIDIFIRTGENSVSKAPVQEVSYEGGLLDREEC